MRKASIRLMIGFLGIFLIVNGFFPKGFIFDGEGLLGVGWIGLLMALGFILLAVSLHSNFEELVGKDNIKYVWYCWIMLIAVLLGGDEVEPIIEAIEQRILRNPHP